MYKSVFEQEYDVHHYEVDRNGRIFVASIMNYLEDSAASHAESLNIGMDYLLENKIAWVIYKWDVKFNKYARVTDKLNVRTKPYSIRKFYAYRQYEVLSSEGEVIVSANSLWFLINVDKRRPTKINEHMCRQFGMGPEDNGQLEFEKLSAPENSSLEKEFSVRYADIDTNKHVNNVRYISWALETVPHEILENCTLKELKINYEKETSYGEDVRVLCQVHEEDLQYIIISSIVNSNNEKLTLMKTVWNK
jgi:medium-chain acyl-[acyl-carrier-protein] hydrolase